MTKAIFFFFATMMILVPVLLHAGSFSIAQQLLICTPFLLVLGIPHGAIDNVLFLRETKMSNATFIGGYLVFVAGNVALWLLFPIFSYALFLLLSAYHFGQGQFTHYFKEQRIVHKATYLCWGLGIISALLYFNRSDIEAITASYEDFAGFGAVHNFEFILTIFLTATASTLLLMSYMVVRRMISAETLFMEILVLGLILLSFYLLPLVIGFSLYFVILHSFKVLGEEFNFLVIENEIKSVWGFVRLVAPFTLFSLLGIALLFGLIHLQVLGLSYGYCLLIVISSITLPHVFVMNRFYALLFRKKFYPQSL